MPFTLVTLCSTTLKLLESQGFYTVSELKISSDTAQIVTVDTL